MVTQSDVNKALAHTFNGLVQYMASRCAEQYQVPLRKMLSTNVWRKYGPLISGHGTMSGQYIDRLHSAIYHELHAYPSPRVVRMQSGELGVQFYDKSVPNEVAFTEARRFGTRDSMHTSFRTQFDKMIRKVKPEGFRLEDDMFDDAATPLDPRADWEVAADEGTGPKHDASTIEVVATLLKQLARVPSAQRKAAIRVDLLPKILAVMQAGTDKVEEHPVRVFIMNDDRNAAPVYSEFKDTDAVTKAFNDFLMDATIARLGFNALDLGIMMLENTFAMRGATMFGYQPGPNMELQLHVVMAPASKPRTTLH